MSTKQNCGSRFSKCFHRKQKNMLFRSYFETESRMFYDARNVQKSTNLKILKFCHSLENCQNRFEFRSYVILNRFLHRHRVENG